MTQIRRLTLATLVALFIALGTAVPIAAAGRPVQPDLCPWRTDQGPCEVV